MFEDHQLGQTDGVVTIESREDNRIAVAKMAEQCRERIQIISRELDPPLYGTVEFVNAVKKMILNNHRTRVRILLIEPKTVIKYGHRLLDLALDLSSFIKIRSPGPDYSGFNEAVFIADACGYLYRPNTSRFEGTVNFNDKLTSRDLMDRFEQMWEKALPDVNLRKLNI